MSEDQANGLSRKFKLKQMSWKKWLVLIVAIAIAAAGAYFYNDYRNLQKENTLLSDPTEVAKAANADLIKKVSQITELPNGETPTIATVTDASKLKSQSFFAQAENGDKVLIFTQAKRAYLYRPSTNKIVQIAPVNIGKNDKTTPAPDTTNTTDDNSTTP